MSRSARCRHRNGQPYAILALFGQKAAKQLTALSRLINKDTESLELIVKAGGTLKSPKFKLDTTRAENQLREEIKEEIKSRADEIIDKNIKDEKLKEEGKKLLKQLFK